MQLSELISKLPAIAERLDVISLNRPRQLPAFRAALPASAIATRPVRPEGC
jgi:hypothetical protein